jgi:hypothetical protein
LEKQSFDALSALMGLIAGAVIGGIVNVVVRSYERFKESQGMALALKSEIEALVKLATFRQYVPLLDAMIARLNDPQHQPVIDDMFAVRITQDYFSTFHSLSEKIGLLGPLAADVTLAYSAMKSLFEDIAQSYELFERWLDGRPLPATPLNVRERLLSLNGSIRNLMVSCMNQGTLVGAALQARADQRFCLWNRPRRA